MNVASGVDFNTGSSEPLLLVRGSHIAASGQGIRSNALQSVISGNLIYSQVMASPEAAALPGFEMQRSAILEEA